MTTSGTGQAWLDFRSALEAADLGVPVSGPFGDASTGIGVVVDVPAVAYIITAGCLAQTMAVDVHVLGTPTDDAVVPMLDLVESVALACQDAGWTPDGWRPGTVRDRPAFTTTVTR